MDTGLAGVRWVAACLLIVTCGVAQAQIWKHVDAQGTLHYSNERQHPDAELLWFAGTAQSRNGTGRGAGDFPEHSANRVATAMERSPGYHAVKDELAQASQSYGVDLALLKAVVAAESAFDHRAVSHKGAVGLMQLMPATARRYGVQPQAGLAVERRLVDPVVNIHAGTRYLSDLLRLFNGEMELAVAAYNAGEGAVKRAGNQIPNYRETRHYVSKVMAIYRVLQGRA